MDHPSTQWKSLIMLYRSKATSSAKVKVRGLSTSPSTVSFQEARIFLISCLSTVRSHQVL